MQHKASYTDTIGNSKQMLKIYLGGRFKQSNGGLFLKSEAF
jgi:hypothetical protein